jgi:hypothetical protein
LDDRDLGAGPAWTRVHADGSYLGTLTKTDKTEASVVLNNVRVKDLYVIAQRCPGCGSLAVLFDGRRVDTIRLAARRSQSRVVIKVAGFSATRTGDIKLRVISSGAPVKIDGLVLLTIS